jgi:hypothetical protein
LLPSPLLPHPARLVVVCVVVVVVVVVVDVVVVVVVVLLLAQLPGQSIISTIGPSQKIVQK